MASPWLRAAWLGLHLFALTTAGCSGKEAEGRGTPDGVGASGQGGATVPDPREGGRVADGSSENGAAGAGGAHVEGGSGVIVVVGPVSDAAPECDGGRRAVTKVDLLFMIDNSASMADKQAILTAAVPDVVNRLVDPPCVDPRTGAQVGTRNPDGTCANGVPDFDPVKDLHIGIITSSLGAHGLAGVCDDIDARKNLPHNNDRGHLVARTSTDAPVPTFENKGFLNWNPGPSLGGSVMTEVVVPFQTMVIGVGQHGCGYEAQLEAIYRFLVEPDPYDTVTIDTSQNPYGPSVRNGVDAVVLQQRADFLRPDSLVAVVAVTDENDCSILDSGQGYYPLLPGGNPGMSVLPHSTSVCLTNPNDKCCHNCFSQAPAGCQDPSTDSECQKGFLLSAEDPANLRCWQQKRRYGADFLYPVQRYIDGFLNAQVPDRSGNMVQNPLYSDLQCKGGLGCLPRRETDLVFFAGIIGVPWQDIAVDPTDLTKGYQTPLQMAAGNVWGKILGDPQNPNGPVAPTDPHMIESIAPRTGLAGPTSAATADPIHGHEWDPSNASPPNSDLQFACTFELNQPKICTEAADCDCFMPTGINNSDSKSPLCQDPATGAYSNVQVRAKAYPGLRQLEVLKGLGDQGIVGSICPANSRNTTAADYGYRPVIAAIVGRLRNSLRGCYVVR